MKLRNKKTGEIVDVESLGHAESLKEKYGYQVTLSWKTKYENLSQCKSYESLAELNEDWEDYKPTEPLIKDENVREIVRALFDVWKVECVKIDSNKYFLVTTIEAIGKGWKLEIPNININGVFKPTELCGEEEAPEPLEPTFVDLDERIKEKEEEWTSTT